MEEKQIMRIIILADSYLPDGYYSHAQMLHDLALEYVKYAHEVVVLSPAPKGQKQLLLETEIDGVTVWRFKALPTRGVSHIKRAFAETLLSFFAYRAIRHPRISKDFDICINYSPTIFFAPLARWFKRKGAFVYLILRDFFPQWIIDSGMINERSVAARYFRAVEQLNYRSSDVVALQSPANVKVFQALNHPQTYPIDVLFNWSSGTVKLDGTFATDFLATHGIQNKFVLFYGGNMGYAQDMPSILRLAQSMTTYTQAHFLLVGQGDQYELIAQQIADKNLSNVTIAPSISQSQYLALLHHVNVGLFTLSSTHSAHNFPGKILNYLAAGLPILGYINRGNDLIEICNDSGAGYVSENGNFDKFLGDAIKIMSSLDTQKKMAIAAQKLLLDKFSAEAAAAQIIERFESRKSEK